MKHTLYTFVALFLMAFASCSKDSTDIASSSSPDYAGSSSGSSSGGGSGGGNQPGVITAGEWNDLAHWNFWQEIIAKQDFSKYPGYWKFFPVQRVSVRLVDAVGLPVTDALVQLKQGTSTTFTARTDNKGTAELWAGLFQGSAAVDWSACRLDINNGSRIVTQVKPYEQGINEITLPAATAPQQRIEVAFVVDATGSMSDELEYLKTELLDVIGRVKSNNPGATVATSSVFYRDEGDEYVTRVSAFSTDPQVTVNFIKAQAAGGGGDTPEAVHTALEKALNELQWSASARSRLLFLLLDAPPHYNDRIIGSLQASVQKASAGGIKIIPITASGINKDTEFLMRFFAVATNGTYVFITGHSGIGNTHLEPTVGPYEVEFLNNLMVRLINKYAQ